MGRGVRTILNMLNPEVVVFGGMYCRTYPLVADVIAAEIEAGLSAPLAQVEFRIAELGADSVLVGASEQAFEALLSDPLGHLVRSRDEQVA